MNENLKKEIKQELKKEFKNPTNLKKYLKENSLYNKNQQLHEAFYESKGIKVSYSSASNGTEHFLISFNIAHEGLHCKQFALDYSSLTKRGKSLYKKGFVNLLFG